MTNIDCEECKYWEYKTGCSRFLYPPNNYKDCYKFSPGKLEEKDNTSPSLTS